MAGRLTAKRKTQTRELRAKKLIAHERGVERTRAIRTRQGVPTTLKGPRWHAGFVRFIRQTRQIAKQPIMPRKKKKVIQKKAVKNCRANHFLRL